MAEQPELHVVGLLPGSLDPIYREALQAREDLEQIADAEIERFNQYFVEHVEGSPLIGPERAIIKTYLHWKTHTPPSSGELPEEAHAD